MKKREMRENVKSVLEGMQLVKNLKFGKGIAYRR